MSNNLDVRDLVTLVQAIEHHKGKYIKQTLMLLEKEETLTPTARKIILDGFNNFNRQVLRLLDYSVEK